MRLLERMWFDTNNGKFLEKDTKFQILFLEKWHLQKKTNFAHKESATSGMCFDTTRGKFLVKGQFFNITGKNDYICRKTQQLWSGIWKATTLEWGTSKFTPIFWYFCYFLHFCYFHHFLILLLLSQHFGINHRFEMHAKICWTLPDVFPVCKICTVFSWDSSFLVRERF